MAHLWYKLYHDNGLRGFMLSIKVLWTHNEWPPSTSLSLKGKYMILVQEKNNCFLFCVKISSICHPLSILHHLHLLLGDHPCWCTSPWQEAVPPILAWWNGEPPITSRRRGDSSLAMWWGCWPVPLGCAWDILFCVGPRDEHECVYVSLCVMIYNCIANLYVYQI